MQRMRDDMDVFNSDVAKFVFKEGTEYSAESPLITNIKDNLITDLKPLEMRVSKSKEKGKGYFRYMIFSCKNLRLYNTVEEYLKDLPELEHNNKFINQKIQKINQLAGLNLAAVRETDDKLDELILPPMPGSEDDEINNAWASDDLF